jgi:UV DNA damage endonuclease
MQQPDLCLGFAVRPVARPELRLPADPPHLSIALAHLRDMLGYLKQIHVRFYRLPNLFGRRHSAAQQLADCRAELAHIAELAAAQNLRFSMHLDHNLALAQADAAAAARSLAEIEAQASLLSSLAGKDQGNARLVMHFGAPAGDQAGLERFLARYRSLSPEARGRLCLEHDHHVSLGTLLRLHRYCGIPLIFDLLHWRLHNPEQLSLNLALGLALATWPTTSRPEIHISSQRTEAHLLPARAGQPARVLAPRPGQHADFINPADARELLAAARGLPAFDMMLEAKAGDLALLRLRRELVGDASKKTLRLGEHAGTFAQPQRLFDSPVLQ